MRNNIISYYIPIFNNIFIICIKNMWMEIFKLLQRSWAFSSS